ncbi:hypothetical protein L914_16644 [Phytophthora nicotianae]|uniref:Uncharacterized protein n=1 Tax=Phytophthora nicotianae TaxID=4792 RepID=W2MK44_PHYNI|nr:hypothetical protein L914_16644 [Phytophthora nicotianae]
MIGYEVEVEAQAKAHSLSIPHSPRLQEEGSSMSVRREVVSLSQLLRRNENSSSRRGTGRAPPLPLQTSRRRADTPQSTGQWSMGSRQVQSAPFTEKPATTGFQQSFTQCVLDASRVLTSQSEVGVSSQTSSGFPAPSQEVYAPESDELSGITSMSQSSFSQPQSQNLLGSSQDDQLYRLQQWQAERVVPASKSPVHCNGSEKLQELEQNLTKAFVEHRREQKQQHQELLMKFGSPIKKSIAEVEAKLASSCESHQQQKVAIGELEKGVSHMAESISALRQQSKEASEEIRTAVVDETAAVKASLTELQARVETVEGSVKSYSDFVAQALKEEATKHDALLSAVEASSCTFHKEPAFAEDFPDTDMVCRKRRRSSRLHEIVEMNPGSFTSPAAKPLPHPRARYSPRCEIGSRSCYESEDDETRDEGLHFVLRRIETLRAKRRQYQHDL